MHASEEKRTLLDKIENLSERVLITRMELREAEKNLSPADIVRITNRVLKIHGKKPVSVSRITKSKSHTATMLSNILYSLVQDSGHEVD